MEISQTIHIKNLWDYIIENFMNTVFDKIKCFRNIQLLLMEMLQHDAAKRPNALTILKQLEEMLEHDAADKPTAQTIVDQLLTLMSKEAWQGDQIVNELVERYLKTFDAKLKHSSSKSGKYILHIYIIIDNDLF